MMYRIADAVRRAPGLASLFVDPKAVIAWGPREHYAAGETSRWIGHAYLEVDAQGQHTDRFHVGLVTTAGAHGGACDIMCHTGVQLKDVVQLAGSLDDLKRQLERCLWLLPGGALPACEFTRGDVLVRAAYWDHQMLAWDGARMLIRRRKGPKDGRVLMDDLSIEPRWTAELPNAETQLHRWDERLLEELQREDRGHAAFVLEGYLKDKGY